MRILVDLQPMQADIEQPAPSRSELLGFTGALAALPEVDGVDILLNAGVHPETTLSVRWAIRGALPNAAVHVFDASWPWDSGDELDVGLHRRAEFVRDQMIVDLDPDIVLVSSIFSAAAQSVVAVAPSDRPFTVVLCRDLPPRLATSQGAFQPDTPWFDHRVASLANADLVLTSSSGVAEALSALLGSGGPPTSVIGWPGIVPSGGTNRALLDEIAWEEVAARGVAAIERTNKRRRVGDRVDGMGSPTSLGLVLPGADPAVVGSDGVEPLSQFLGREYDVTLVPVDSDRCARELDSFERLVVVIDNRPDSAGALEAVGRWPAVLVALDADLSKPLDVHGGFATLNRAQLSYLQDGLAGLSGPAGVGPEIMRVGCGTLALESAVAASLASGSGGLDPGMLVTVDPNSLLTESAKEVARAIEGWHRRAGTVAHAVQTASPGTLPYVAMNRQDRRGGALYHDVTRLSHSAQRSGIQRVSVALARELVRLHSDRVFMSRRDGVTLRHDTSLWSEIAPPGSHPAPDLPSADAIRALPGDVLLLSELYVQDDDWYWVLNDWRARGGIYAQVVYDLLPARLEDFFADAREWFVGWLDMVTTHADLLVCDSEDAARDLRAWIDENPLNRVNQPEVTWMRLGYDLNRSAEFPQSLRRRPRGGRRVLIVGTIEPRKGVEVILDAAESLWRRGEDLEFVFVGNPGWAMPSIIDRLQDLHDSEKPLTWIVGASDDELRLQYLDADLLVMASRGEGFGLPIVEALAHGVPVVARDLPVFRELLGDEGSYFRLDADLADAILRRIRSSDPIAFVPDRLVTWGETAQDLLSALQRHQTSCGTAPA